MQDQDNQLTALLTVRDVANWMSVSPSLIYQLVESGELPVYRIGCGRGAIRFRTNDVELYLETRRSIRIPQTPASVRKVGPQLKHIRVE